MKYTRKPRQGKVLKIENYYMEIIRIQIQAVVPKVLKVIFNTATM